MLADLQGYFHIVAVLSFWGGKLGQLWAVLVLADEIACFLLWHHNINMYGALQGPHIEKWHIHSWSSCFDYELY